MEHEIIGFLCSCQSFLIELLPSKGRNWN